MRIKWSRLNGHFFGIFEEISSVWQTFDLSFCHSQELQSSDLCLFSFSYYGMEERCLPALLESARCIYISPIRCDLSVHQLDNVVIQPVSNPSSPSLAILRVVSGHVVPACAWTLDIPHDIDSPIAASHEVPSSLEHNPASYLEVIKGFLGKAGFLEQIM